MPEHDIIIVCPLRVEARAVERALRRTGLTGIELRCCGIGALAVRRALATESSRPVLLVGLGGGLDPEMAIGNTYLAERVVDEGGRTWTPTPLSTNGAIGRCTIVGMDRIVEGPEDRRAVRAGTGAAVVDMEAHALGAWADEVALPWQVLRSVSDASGDTLPAEAIAWFTPQGGIRGGRIAFDLIRRPPLLRPVLHLRRTVAEALRSLEAAVGPTVQSFREALR